MESNHYAMRRDPMTFAEAKISAEGGDKLRGTSHHPVPHGHFISLFFPTAKKENGTSSYSFPSPTSYFPALLSSSTKDRGRINPHHTRRVQKAIFRIFLFSLSANEYLGFSLFFFIISHSTPRDWAKEWWTDSPFGSHRYNQQAPLSFFCFHHFIFFRRW